jgi:hypothetical protein
MTAPFTRATRTDMSWTPLALTYAFIERFINEHGQPPSLFQVARGRGIGYEAARGQVELLQFRGWIHRDIWQRSIELRGITG